MLLIADSSALIALSVMDGLTLLDQLFHRVAVPEAVYREVTADESLPEAKQLKLYLHDKRYQLASDSGAVLLDAYGDMGEMEAMYLYKQLHADRLLIDDARGRKVAQINHIAVIGSIGVLLLAKQKGLLPLIKPKIDLLVASQLYVAPALIQQALLNAGE
jgi:predicted nucleic acid-binding protein